MKLKVLFLNIFILILTSISCVSLKQNRYEKSAGLRHGMKIELLSDVYMSESDRYFLIHESQFIYREVTSQDIPLSKGTLLRYIGSKSIFNTSTDGMLRLNAWILNGEHEGKKVRINKMLQSTFDKDSKSNKFIKVFN